MRTFYLLLLLLFLAVIGIFAWQNQGVVGVRFLDRAFEHSLAVVVGAAYLLGMLTGGTVVGLLRRSMRRVTAEPPPPTAGTRASW
jgi:uncharacterized integral membrane protein